MSNIVQMKEKSSLKQDLRQSFKENYRRIFKSQDEVAKSIKQGDLRLLSAKENCDKTLLKRRQKNGIGEVALKVISDRSRESQKLSKSALKKSVDNLLASLTQRSGDKPV